MLNLAPHIKTLGSAIMNAKLLLSFLLVLPLVLIGQQAENQLPLDFYHNRAQEDASYEHNLEWTYEEDEKDFWFDQRLFERDLRKKDHEGYLAYMEGKKVAYTEHEQVCDEQCHHGKYYRIQSKFYTRFNSAGKVLTKATEARSGKPSAVLASGFDHP